MNLFPHEIDKMMESLQSVDMNYQTKLKRSKMFKETFPKDYVEFIDAEPETMQFDQSSGAGSATFKLVYRLII